jgi:alpha-galactosidase
MSAAPLLMRHDVRETPPEMLKLLLNREVIADDQVRRRRGSSAKRWKPPRLSSRRGVHPPS